MSASAGEGARKLGERLLAEVEVEDLSSVLKSLRELQVLKNESNTGPQNTFSGLPYLDALLSTSSPILEIISPPPTHHPSGAGKTSLLYLIIAHAILPPTFSSTALSGHNASIILFDPLHHFSILRLAAVMLNIILTNLRSSSKPISEPAIKTLIKSSLTHVHVLRPQSWTSLLATLRSLPDYLFDASRHKSMYRRIHSIVLDDIDAFTWGIRNTPSTATTSNHMANASALLTSVLKRLQTTFSCGVILTSHSSMPNQFRPSLPMSWPQDMQTTRLAVRRVEILKFAPMVSVEEAEVERRRRWEVVKKGRFECWKVGIGVRDGDGFVFRVGEKGVEIESEEMGDVKS